MKLTPWLWRNRGLGAVPIALCGVLFLRGLGVLQPLELGAYDRLLTFVRPHLRSGLRPGTIGLDPRIIVVGIDEADIAWLGRSELSDEVYGDLLERIVAEGPRAIGFDIYRNLPVEPGHDRLVRLFESTPYVIGIEKVVGRPGLERVAPSPVLAARGQVGANDLIVDPDGVVRRGLISVDVAGETRYGLGVFLALLYLERSGIEPVAESAGGAWRLGPTRIEALTADSGGYVGADVGGFQVMLGFPRGQWGMGQVSLRSVLEGRLPRGWARDRIVLIGKVGESFQDLYATPFSSRNGQLPERLPGVHLHAQLASQLLDAAAGRFPFREASAKAEASPTPTLLRSWPEPIEGLWLLPWAWLGAGLVWWGRGRLGWGWLVGRLVLGLGAGLGIGAIGALGLIQGYWIPVVPPLLAMLGAGIGVLGYVAWSAEQIRRTFGRYLSDAIVATLLEQPQGLALGGERRRLTLLTSDLRGFTSLSESLPPERVITVINAYLKQMAEVITDYGGTIDEFMGDGILVLFGAPTVRPDDAQRGIACAIAMQRAMDSVNSFLGTQDLPALEMGIGVHTGEVVVGNIGSERRTKYGVLGAQVNLTYRLESYTLGGQVLISEACYGAAGGAGLIQIGDRRQVFPKGVRSGLWIYEVLAVGAPFELVLPQVSEQWVRLVEPIAIGVVLLDDKDASQPRRSAQIVALSERGVRLDLEFEFAPLSTVKLIWDEEMGEMESYGKVVDGEGPDCWVRFTARSQAAIGDCDRWRNGAVKPDRS